MAHLKNSSNEAYWVIGTSRGTKRHWETWDHILNNKHALHMYNMYTHIYKYTNTHILLIHYTCICIGDVMLGTLAQSVKVFKAEQSLTTWVFPQELHDRRRKWTPMNHLLTSICTPNPINTCITTHTHTLMNTLMQHTNICTHTIDN